MTNPTFKIRKLNAVRPKEGLPAFVLQQDKWNDYSFQTLYHLYFYDIDSTGRIEETLIGPVKILKRGQTKEHGIQLTADFDDLGDEYCSVGQSLDYYERLNAFEDSVKVSVLTALRDVIQTPSLVEQFNEEAGWATSLFRDHPDVGARFMTLARGLITGDYAKVPNESMAFSFDIPGWLSPIEFRFDAPASGSGWESKVLPERIAVLVGRNGSGKSTLLARLARVAFGSLDERSRKPLSDLGRIEPSGVGFPRIITIAFSPFDSFKLPGSDNRNRKQVIKEMERGEGRFSFIGLRDVTAESNSRSSAARKGGDEDDSLIVDRLGKTRLKSIQELADEFTLLLEKVRSKDRLQILQDFALELFVDSPFQGSQIASIDSPIADARARFLACSTGHKIALLIVTGLLANIEPYSLVLVDEVETHLHPPLLASLMHALRNILRKHEAFAIFATHSPVVVQESLARHVSVVRREGEMIGVLPVNGETFGESIGLISAEVFGLQTDATDFHKVLDRLIKRHNDVDEIEGLFFNKAMSHQARAYVMSRLSAPKKD